MQGFHNDALGMLRWLLLCQGIGKECLRQRELRSH